MNDIIGWIVAGVVAVFAWLWSLRQAKRSGRNKERLKQHDTAADQRDKVNEADKHTDTVSSSDKRDSLFKHSDRD